MFGNGFGKLPASNVLKSILEDGLWIAVRSSGIEPKIKIYYSIKSIDARSVENRLTTIQKKFSEQLGLYEET